MIVLNGRRNGGALAFSPDARTLVAGSEGGLQIWRGLAAGTRPKVHKGVEGWCFRFAPDGERLYLDGRTPGCLDLRSDTFTAIPGAGAEHRCLAFSPDTERVVAVTSPMRAPSQIEGWSTHALGVPLWTITTDRDCRRPWFLAGDRFFLKEAPNPTGEFAFVVRSAATGAELGSSAPLAWFPDWEVASADGKWIAGAKEQRVGVWSVADLKRPPVEWKGDTRKNFTDIQFHPSGRYLAATSNDETVKLYDTATWEVARTFTWEIGKMRSIAFSADGTLAAAGSESGKVVVWDVDV